MIYRMNADALLRLATDAARAPGADLDAILAILRGADVETDDDDPGVMPDVSDGPELIVGPGGSGGSASDKLAKPE